MNYVFVYGTLKANHGNHRLLETSNFIRNSKIKGSLWEVSVFPGYKLEGDGTVYGEIYEVSDETLQRLDFLEGYSEDRNDNMYNRVLVETLDDFHEKVYTYVWNE